MDPDFSGRPGFRLVDSVLVQSVSTCVHCNIDRSSLARCKETEDGDGW